MRSVWQGGYGLRLIEVRREGIAGRGHYVWRHLMIGRRISAARLSRQWAVQRLLVGMTVALGVLAVATPMPAGADVPIGMVPLDGAHWQAGAGLPDANGNASVGMVQTADGSVAHIDVARVRGFDRLSTSALTSLGFAVGPLPSGIEPCWKVLLTNPDGTEMTVHVDASTDTRGITATALGGGWTQWTWTPTLPAGTITEVIDGVMTTPGNAGQVAFDNFTANGLTATKGGQVSR
jgi:hypothetical protein